MPLNNQTKQFATQKSVELRSMSKVNVVRNFSITVIQLTVTFEVKSFHIPLCSF